MSKYINEAVGPTDDEKAALEAVNQARMALNAAIRAAKELGIDTSVEIGKVNSLPTADGQDNFDAPATYLFLRFAKTVWAI